MADAVKDEVRSGVTVALECSDVLSFCIQSPKSGTRGFLSFCCLKGAVLLKFFSLSERPAAELQEYLYELLQQTGLFRSSTAASDARTGKLLQICQSLSIRHGKALVPLAKNGKRLLWSDFEDQDCPVESRALLVHKILAQLFDLPYLTYPPLSLPSAKSICEIEEAILRHFTTGGQRPVQQKFG